MNPQLPPFSITSGRAHRLLRVASRLFSPLVAVVAIGYAVRVSVTWWPECVRVVREVSAVGFGLAAVAFFASTGILALAWVALVQSLAGGEPLKSGLWRVYARSWLARYIPGKIVGSITRVYGAQQLGYSIPLLVGSLGYEIVLQILVGMACGSLLMLVSRLYAASFELALKGALLGALVVLTIAIVAPQALLQALRRRWMHLPRRAALTVIGLYVGTYLLGGMGVALLAPGVSHLGNVLYVMGAVNLAGVLGMVSAVTPAGIGVREGILTAFLAPAIGAPAGLSVAVLSRVLRVLADLLFSAICYIFDRPERRS